MSSLTSEPDIMFKKYVAHLSIYPSIPFSYFTLQKKFFQTRAQALKHYSTKVDYIKTNLETLEDTIQKKRENTNYLVNVIQSKIQTQTQGGPQGWNIETVWIMLWDIHILIEKKKRLLCKFLSINDYSIGTNSVFSIYDSFMISHFTSFRKCGCSNLYVERKEIKKRWARK